MVGTLLFRRRQSEPIGARIVAFSAAKGGSGTMNKVLLAAVLLITATSAAAAQGYYFAAPYGYSVYEGDFPGTYAYVREPYAAPPIAYGYDPYGTTRNWQYYRPSGPGRGNNEESTR
jgi:hypothetical protein